MRLQRGETLERRDFIEREDNETLERRDFIERGQ